MSNANRSQWLFPKNEVGKVVGWSTEASPSNPNASKGLVNLDYVGPADLAGKQDASDNLTTVAAGMKSARAYVGEFNAVADLEAATIAADVNYITVAGQPYERVTSNYWNLGPELVTNGSATTDTAFTKGAGWSHDTDKFTHATGSTSAIAQDITLETGRPYIVGATVSGYAGAGSIRPRLNGTSNLLGAIVQANGAFREIMVADSHTGIGFVASSTFPGSIDDITCRVLPLEAITDAAGAWWGPAQIGRRNATFGSMSEATGSRLSVAPNTIYLTGYASAGDGGAALYGKTSSEPSHPGKLSITLTDGTTVWYELAESEITPAMFGAYGGSLSVDDYPGIINGLDAALALNVPFRFLNKLYAIGTKIVRGVQPISSGTNSVLRPLSGSGLTDCWEVSDGVVSGFMWLPRMNFFSGTALEMKGSHCHVYIPGFSNCGTAIRWQDAGNGTIHFVSIANCDLAVEWNCSSSSSVIQGSKIVGQFITSTTNAFRFSGTNGAIDGQNVDVQSVDFTSGGGSLLENTISPAKDVARLSVTINGWLGGTGFDDAVTPTKLIGGTGGFSHLSLNLKTAKIISQANFSGAEIAGWFQFGNLRTHLQAFEMQTTADLPTFNSGSMIAYSSFTLKHTLASNLAAGAALDLYFFHVLANDRYPYWTVQQTSDYAAVVESVTDQNTSTTGLVRVRVRNVSGSSIASSSTLTFTAHHL